MDTGAVTPAARTDLANAEAGTAAFELHLDGFQGPFDVLLDLIGRHELEVTELALAAVTDEFLAHLAQLPDGADLDETSGFLVVGATLLDLKIAGLLPQGEAVDVEAIAALEARDLLFARLLQYRAFKQAAAWFGERLAAEESRHAHHGVVDERLVAPAPPSDLGIDAAAFAALAAAALAPKAPKTVGLDHLHAPVVSLRAQAAEVVALLRGRGALTFLDLAGDDADRPVVVARFLAVLELYRLGALAFEQLEPLGALVLTWSARDWDDTMLERLGGEAA